MSFAYPEPTLIFTPLYLEEELSKTEADMASHLASDSPSAAQIVNSLLVPAPHAKAWFARPSFMAEPMQADEPVTISHTLPTTPTSLTSTSNLTTASESVGFLKPRSPSNVDSNLSSIASAGLDSSFLAKSPNLGKVTRFSAQPMTAAAAMADQQRLEKEREHLQAQQTSPNPQKQALGALMGVGNDSMSKPKDAPTATNTMSEPLAAVAKAIQIPPDGMQVDSQAQTSPVSLSSFGTLDSTTAPAVANISTVDSPASIDDASAREREGTPKGDGPGPASPEDTNKAFSYPGPLIGAQLKDPRRGMSLPQSGLRHGSPRSPSTKKHRCPYCSTEFTRHHNLKSHLLTHSQEKPYVCQTCQSRFRRLHDLKRHTKLHTGERPHICPKCGRRFARGDALARHNKGQGGCAGRRASMGSYGGDDDYGEGAGSGEHDGSMDGLVYTEPGQMDEDDDPRRQSMPSIKRHDAPPDPHSRQTAASQSGFQARGPSTYPPLGPGRQPSGGLFPPNPSHGGGSSSSTSPTSQTGTGNFPPVGSGSSPFNTSAPGPAVFPTSAMTESPKPLSPNAVQPHHSGHSQDSGIHRNRSPSLTQQFQQQHFGRGTGRGTPPGAMGLPPPQPGAPQLPPPHVLNPPDPRYTLPSQGPAHPPAQPSGPPTHMGAGGMSSQSNSMSSHGPSHQGSGEGPGTFPQANDRLWAYVRSLEERINGLQDEVTTLRGQLANASQSQNR